MSVNGQLGKISFLFRVLLVFRMASIATVSSCPTPKLPNTRSASQYNSFIFSRETLLMNFDFDPSFLASVWALCASFP